MNTGSHLLVDLARDDHALDLRGALVDLEDLGVAVELLDGLLAGVAVQTPHHCNLSYDSRSLESPFWGHGLLFQSF